MTSTPAPPPAARMPRQIPYIIGNEGCERFSFYGMRNILVQFLITSLLLQHITAGAERELAAKDLMHTFMIGVYFFPLLGGYHRRPFFRQIQHDPLVQPGLLRRPVHASPFFVDRPTRLLHAGLGLIALGSGGIKPLVASFVGDQFTQANKHLAKIVFDGFYWIINFGSLFASLADAAVPEELRSAASRSAFPVC